MDEINIRFATEDDWAAIAEAEAMCFPESERAESATIKERLAKFADCFLLLFCGGRLAAYIDGAASDRLDLTDDMFSSADCHDENGRWQFVYGLGVVPDFRGRGFAGALVREFCDLAKRRKKLGVVLTCKPKLVPFYSKFGFKDEGVCPSSHGGAVWHQMRMTF